MQKAEALTHPHWKPDQGTLTAMENAFQALEGVANGNSETQRFDQERASAWLAVCYLKGLGCEQDVDKAIEIASPAAGWREPVAMYALAAAQIQQKIDSVPEEMSVSYEDNPAIGDIERVYENLSLSDFEELKHIADLLEFSKHQNLPPAAYLQSQVYFALGWGALFEGEQSCFRKSGLRALQDATDAGYAPAQFNMAGRLLHVGGDRSDIATSAAFYAEKAYRQGYRPEDSAALYNKAQDVIAASAPQALAWSTP
jgi:TPR repeat protein